MKVQIQTETLNIMQYPPSYMKYMLCCVKQPSNCVYRKNFDSDDQKSYTCAKKQLLNCKSVTCNNDETFPKDCPLTEVYEEKNCSNVRFVHETQTFLNK